MSTLLSYVKINPDNLQKLLVLKFNCIDDEVIVHESYCSNPNCDCKDATLMFVSKKKIETLCSFSINLETLKVRDIEQYLDYFDINQLIKEFISDFSQIKPLFEKHYIEVKEYAKKDITINIPVNEIFELIEEKNVVPYSLVFYENYKPISFLDYEINDNYCMNPSCHCDDVILEFNKNNNKSHFVLIWSFKNNQIEVISSNCEMKTIEDVRLHILNERKELIQLFKDRYKELKQIGKKIIHIKKPKPLTSKKVGPNEPCPCGSGKKYKKCCGG